METHDFHDSVADLNLKLTNTVEQYFKERSFDFRLLDFMLEAAADIDKISRDAFFYGAEIFPK